MADKSLNQQIAEALGYTVKPVPSLEDKDRIAYYLYCDPTGEGVHYADDMISVPVTGHNEAAAWERGNSDYEHSLDAVAEELRDNPVTLQIDFTSNTVTLHDWSHGRGSTATGAGDTVEQQAAETLLAWAKAHKS